MVEQNRKWEYCNVGTPSSPNCDNSDLGAFEPQQPPSSGDTCVRSGAGLLIMKTMDPVDNAQAPAASPGSAASTTSKKTAKQSLVPQLRIIGGSEATSRQFPFQVSLLLTLITLITLTTLITLITLITQP